MKSTPALERWAWGCFIGSTLVLVPTLFVGCYWHSHDLNYEAKLVAMDFSICWRPVEWPKQNWKQWPAMYQPYLPQAGFHLYRFNGIAFPSAKFRRYDTDRYRCVDVPLLLIPCAGGLLVGTLRWRRRPKAGHCSKCGYCLRANLSGRCPECGTLASSGSPSD